MCRIHKQGDPRQIKALLVQATGETELRWPFLMYDIPAVVVDDMEESVSRGNLFVKGELLVPYCEFANQIPNANFARETNTYFHTSEGAPKRSQLRVLWEKNKEEEELLRPQDE